MKHILILFFALLVVLTSCNFADKKAINSVDETLKKLNDLPGGKLHLSSSFNIPMYTYPVYKFESWKLEANSEGKDIEVAAYVTQKNGFGVTSNHRVMFIVNKTDYQIKETVGLFAIDEIPDDLLSYGDLEKIKNWEKEKVKIKVIKTEWHCSYGVAEGYTTVENNSNVDISNLRFVIDFYDRSGKLCTTEETLALTNQLLVRGGKKRINWLTNYSDCATSCRVNLKFPSEF